MKKKLLTQSKLYSILDYSATEKRNIVSAAKALIAGGSDILQLRFKGTALSRVIKDASYISRLAARSKTIFIINDRLDVALLVNADGVHLGQNDIPISSARKLLGREKIIGISTHSKKQALFAQNQGADYISIGPVFKTPTKPEYKAVGLALIKKVKPKLRIPFVAIGGINLDNIERVLNSGAKMVAVVRAVCGAKNIQHAVRSLKLKLNRQ
ncbi:MAG: thiamine phosphate synthase [Candidatus Omnitrophota bacterium]|nr:thiamine phosphate synthase [Candidatus Omnitrophota bacterium]